MHRGAKERINVNEKYIKCLVYSKVTNLEMHLECKWSTTAAWKATAKRKSSLKVCERIASMLLERMASSSTLTTFWIKGIKPIIILLPHVYTQERSQLDSVLFYKLEYNKIYTVIT